MPFLTDLDERAEVRGSRDPLGLVPIWSKFGREVVGNLTTVTGTVRGFTTLLVGLELARHAPGAILGPKLRRISTRFSASNSWLHTLGSSVTKIRLYGGFVAFSRRMNEGRRIRISADPAAQILSSQKTYGLWGLFTVPARSSGVLMKREPRLTPQARDFVHRQYFPMLENGRGVKSVLELLRRDSYDLQPAGRDAKLLEAIGRIHSRRLRSEEQTFYRDHLAWGGAEDSTGGRQRALANILGEVESQEFGFSRISRCSEESVEARRANARARKDRMSRAVDRSEYASLRISSGSGWANGNGCVQAAR
jgi:hypothetical protein